MPQELKVTTINMKSLNQDIEDPIVAGAGDANGRTLRIIFTQEAAAQITDKTKVYLKWYHQQAAIKGYNVFNQIGIDKPPTWEIKYPRKMMQEGDVTCTIELVDDISIEPSCTFVVHVLSDPYDGEDFLDSDDFTEFQKAVLELNNTNDKIQEDYDSKIETLEQLLKEVQDKDNSCGICMTEISTDETDSTDEDDSCSCCGTSGVYITEISDEEEGAATDE